jgi:DNA-binding NarL/FixJ family response regulator
MTAIGFREIAAAAGFDSVEVVETVAHALGETVDLLVLDLDIGEEAALYACATALHTGRAGAVAFLGPREYAGVCDLLSLGAKAYLCVDSDTTFLGYALRALMHGHTVLDPQVTEGVVSHVLGTPDEIDLSDRELEILRLVARGESNKRIARVLNLSPNTVKTYVARAFEKLGCRSRPEAAAELARRGLL